MPIIHFLQVKNQQVLLRQKQFIRTYHLLLIIRAKIIQDVSEKKMKSMLQIHGESLRFYLYLLQMVIHQPLDHLIFSLFIHCKIHLSDNIASLLRRLFYHTLGHFHLWLIKTLSKMAYIHCLKNYKIVDICKFPCYNQFQFNTPNR